jgi:predicted PilT family ATPase
MKKRGKEGSRSKGKAKIREERLREMTQGREIKEEKEMEILVKERRLEDRKGKRGNRLKDIAQKLSYTIDHD